MTLSRSFLTPFGILLFAQVSSTLSLSLKTQLGRIRQELQWGLGAKRVTSMNLRVSDESLYQKKGSATMHEGGKSLTHRVLLHASVQLEPQRSIGCNGWLIDRRCPTATAIWYCVLKTITT